MKTPSSALAILAACALPATAATPLDFAVDIKATVSDTAPHMVLSWTQRVQSNIVSQAIHRRPKGGAAWVKLADLTTTQTSYTDHGAVPGVEYEYWMQRKFTGLYPVDAMGYLSAGVKVPEVHARGVVLLVVDDTMAAPLAGEIAQLKLDLACDGWEVRTIVAPRTGTPAGTKALITAAYQADPGNVKAVFLLGHVPVPYSGNRAPDGHAEHQGAWPADGYYGDMDGTWTDTSVNNTRANRSQNRNVPGDGKFDQSKLPSLVELQVGRVDLHHMTRAPSAATTEETLLRRYLRKAHDYRHKQGAYAAIPRRSLMRDSWGHKFAAEPFAVHAWAAAFSCVGPTVEWAAENGWFAPEAAGGKDYLWGHGGGGGSYEAVGNVGSTADFGAEPSRVVFTSLFGSFHGDWDSDNNVMRSILAGNPYGTSLGLTCYWSGRPNWFPHHPGMGETMGYTTRVAMNNAAVGGGGYVPTGSEALNGGIHIGLMGDPTLRMHMVEPPRSLAATSSAGAVALEWAASGETGLQGYHVYRSEDGGGTFVRLTSAPWVQTHFSDASVVAGTDYLYMVRTLKLESVPGGSYYNLSTGSAVGIKASNGTVAAPANPSGLTVNTVDGAPGVLLSWSDHSADETSFRIERKTTGGSYTELATVPADTVTYTDLGPFVHGSAYYYRISGTGGGGDSGFSNEASFEAVAGFVQFDSVRAKVSKMAGTAVVAVTRAGGASGEVTVTYHTSNSSAVAGVHFSQTSSTVTWADGEQGTKHCTVPITPTATPQLPRQFKLTLANPTGGLAVGGTNSIVVQIEDEGATLDGGWTDLVFGGNVTDHSPAVNAEGSIGSSLIGGSGLTTGAQGDSGRFIYQPRTGDGTITALVLAPQVAQGAGRYGVMVRTSVASDVSFAATVTASPGGHGTRLYYRMATDGSVIGEPSVDNNKDVPRWIRLSRSGNTFTSETSLDGVQWDLLGSKVVDAIPETAQWGLFHLSQKPSNTTDMGDFQLVEFRNVSLTSISPPTSPRSFIMTPSAPGQTSFAWSASPQAQGYRIERRGDDGSLVIVGTIPTGGSATFTDVTGRANMAYEYRIAAFNENGQGPYTAPLRRVIPPAEGLPRPGFLTAAPHAEGNGIQLSWRDFAFGETGFEIQRAVANGPWTSLETLSPNDPAQD